jgi:hypothetical protein
MVVTPIPGPDTKRPLRPFTWIEEKLLLDRTHPNDYCTGKKLSKSMTFYQKRNENMTKVKKAQAVKISLGFKEI